MNFSAACRSGAPRQFCANIWQGLGVKIEYGTQVKSVEDSPAGLRVTLETSGGSECLATAYVPGRGRCSQHNAPFDE